MIVYCATNKVNGKRYIGKTVSTLNERKLEHERLSRLGSKTHFSRAIRKYGGSCFVWKILHNCKSLSKLNEKEIFYIKKLNTIKKGYNLTDGGTGGDTFKNDPNKEERRRKISLAGLGRKPKIYPTTRLLWSKQRRGKKRKPHSKTTKRKIGLKNSGSNNGQAKLTEAVVKKIRIKLKNGRTGYRIYKDMCAKGIKIAQSVIYNIKNRRCWKHC